MAGTTFDPLEPSQPVRRRRISWGFPLLLLVALAIYELTAQPTLGVAIVCLKFGWEDFRTARWLRRVDSQPRRGRACSWLFLASGLWKTAMMATIFMFVLASALPARNPNQNAPGAPPPREFIVAVITAMTAFFLSTLATWVALIKARRAGVQLWLDSSVHEARRNDFWPPQNNVAARTNGARTVVKSAVIVSATVVVLLLLPLFFVLFEKVEPWIAAGCLTFVVGGLPFLLLVSSDYLALGFARFPSDCWGMAPPIDLSGSVAS